MGSEEIEGYLAYFDLQGFSRLIIKTGFKKKFIRFNKIIEESVKLGGNEIYFRYFSDSVVVYTKEISSQKFVEISATLAQISFNLLYYLELPVCGGLSCGRFSLHERGMNVIFAGEPMVEAVELEQSQNWFGISISPNLIENEKSLETMISLPLRNSNIDELNKLLEFPHLLYYVNRHHKVPIKSEHDDKKTIWGFVITPQVINPENPEIATSNILDFVTKLEHLRFRTHSPYIQTKYTNTISMITDFYCDWEIIESKVIH